MPVRRFIDCAVPINACNLRCHYCYITLRKKFRHRRPEFKHAVSTMVRALSPERLGGSCLLNFCGNGETLLAPQLPDMARSLLEQGHLVMIVTNGLVRRGIESLLALPRESLSRLMFKVSFQYLETLRLGLVEDFIRNVTDIREAGASFTVEITPNDELEPKIDEVLDVCRAHFGAPCHVTVARDSSRKDLPILTARDRGEYARIWSRFDSELFRFKLSVFNEKRREFCYAGDWTTQLLLGSGDLRQCNNGRVLQNLFDDPGAPVNFCAVGRHCPNPHCYNAHAWLALGAIPGFAAPTYARVRDRLLSDGTGWLNPRFREAVDMKFEETNRQYDEEQKRLAERYSGGILACPPNIEERRA
ncbi:MAG: radical SAM protein [Planctomycetota bacterium]|nr:radical SAM protein [Planctomycetota bacterium]